MRRRDITNCFIRCNFTWGRWPSWRRNCKFTNMTLRGSSFSTRMSDLLKSIPLSAELQHYWVGRRTPWTWGNVLQAQRWSRVWDLGGEFVCSPVSPFMIMKVPWFTFYFLCGYHSSFIFSVGLPWLGQWALADALCHLRGTDLVCNSTFLQTYEILGPKSSFCLRLQKYFCRAMKSDIKRTQFFGWLSFAFFPGTRGMTWALATALLTKLRR